MGLYGYPPGGQYGGIPYPPAAAPAVRPFDHIGRWRSPVALMLVVLGCLLAPVALAGVWLHVKIMDVEGYVATITPVADEPAVQEAVADVLAEQVYHALDAKPVLSDSLPGELGSITGSLGAQELEKLTRRLTLQAVSSSAFRGFWATANRKVHPALLKAIKSGGELDAPADELVGLDLAGVTKNVTDLLSSAAVILPDVFPKALTSGDVALLDTRPLAKAGAFIRALDRLYWLLPLEALALVLSSVLIASKRLRATVGAGFGLALGMVALELGLALGRAYYLGVTDDAGIPHEASAAVWRVVTSALRLWGWAVLAVGVVVALTALAALLLSGRGGPQPQSVGPQYPAGPGNMVPTWSAPSR